MFLTKKRIPAMGLRELVVMHDWDGTIVDTMPSHADLAADCINDHFGMDHEDAKRKYLATTGVPFDRQLEIIVPEATLEQRESCAQEYHLRKMTEVYGSPKNFPETAKVLHKMAEIVSYQVISSSTEEGIIADWARKNGCDLPIMGRESGSKKEHIAALKERFPNGFFVFVSDSSGDMSLPVNVTLGVCVPKLKAPEFFQKGAAIVSSGPITLRWVNFCLGMIGQA